MTGFLKRLLIAFALQPVFAVGTFLALIMLYSFGLPGLAIVTWLAILLFVYSFFRLIIRARKYWVSRTSRVMKRNV